MKILFAYFDFSSEHAQSHSFHQLGECELNFDTEFNYSIKKESHVKPDDNYIYTISRHEKPYNERLLPKFWGERIYNITAIVGNNGSGKSTIIHSIIKAVIKGLYPGIPFILVLRPTDSTKPYIFCNDADHIQYDKSVFSHLTDNYPYDLKASKCMLLDNTLSMSSLELNKQYISIISSDHTKNDHINNSYANYESYLQLYNKSLIASIDCSIATSTKDRPTIDSQSVYDVFRTHFCYESFQEVRFLFDRYQRKNLETLKAKKHPVPYPKELIVTVDTLNILEDKYPNLYTETIGLLDLLLKYDFVGHAIIAMYNNFRLFFYDEGQTTFNPNWPRHLSSRHNPLTSFNATATRLKDYLMNAYSNACLHNLSMPLRDDIKRCLKFLDFLVNNEQLLSDIFQPLSNRKQQYRINIDQVLNDNDQTQCMISFLEIYRSICYPHYFLNFSSGMSSWEKNLLRMLTQFRYMLSGPAVYSEQSSEYNTGNHLQNYFSEEEQPVCDTLFLFLDEADLTYHPEWQRRFVSMLTDILPLMFLDPYNQDINDRTGCRDIQVIITTHSPLMLGDFPKASVNYLKTQGFNYTIPDPKHQRSTFGENLYTILKEGFFLDSPLGMFASDRINKAAEWCTKIRNNNYSPEQSNELNDEYKEHYQTAQLLAPGIIKNKLLLELSFCANKLDIHDEEIDPDTLRQHIADLEAELQKARAKLSEEGRN